MDINEIGNILDALGKASSRHVNEMEAIRKVGINEKNVGEFMRHMDALDWIHSEIVYYNTQMKKVMMLG